jgi:hypothetical protein
VQSSTPPFGKMIPASAWKVVAILSSVATMVMYVETMLGRYLPRIYLRVLLLSWCKNQRLKVGRRIAINEIKINLAEIRPQPFESIYLPS